MIFISFLLDVGASLLAMWAIAAMLAMAAMVICAGNRLQASSYGLGFQGVMAVMAGAEIIFISFLLDVGASLLAMWAIAAMLAMLVCAGNRLQASSYGLGFQPSMAVMAGAEIIFISFLLDVGASLLAMWAMAAMAAMVICAGNRLQASSYGLGCETGWVVKRVGL